MNQRGNREHEAPVRGDPMRPTRGQRPEGRLVPDPPYVKPSERDREMASDALYGADQKWNHAMAPAKDRPGMRIAFVAEAIAAARAAGYRAGIERAAVACESINEAGIAAAIRALAERGEQG